MASLSHITNTSVLRASAAVAMRSINKIALLVYTTAIAGRTARYRSADEVSDVFGATHVATIAAQQFFAQNPHPEEFIVLRAALASTKTIVITPTAANSKSYKLKVNETEVSYDADSSATAQEIVEGLKTLIDALSVSGLTVTEDDTALTLTGSAGTYFSVEITSTADDGQMTILETTADAGVATDLAAVQAVDKDWYAVAVADNSEAVNLAASAWCEANGKLFLGLTQDSVVLTNTASNQAADLKDGTRTKTVLVYHHAPRQFFHIGLASAVMSTVPGKRAWHHKEVANVSVSPLNETQIANLNANNVNYYVAYDNLNRSDGGKVSSGEWADIIVGSDYYQIRWNVMKASLLLSERDKVDFDNAGIARFETLAHDLFDEMLRNRFVRLDFVTWPTLGYGVEFPDQDDVSDTDFAARTLNDGVLQAKLRGAIKKSNDTLRLV